MSCSGASPNVSYCRVCKEDHQNGVDQHCTRATFPVKIAWMRAHNLHKAAREQRALSPKKYFPEPTIGGHKRPRTKVTPSKVTPKSPTKPAKSPSAKKLKATDSELAMIQEAKRVEKVHIKELTRQKKNLESEAERLRKTIRILKELEPPQI